MDEPVIFCISAERDRAKFNMTECDVIHWIERYAALMGDRMPDTVYLYPRHYQSMQRKLEMLAGNRPVSLYFRGSRVLPYEEK